MAPTKTYGRGNISIVKPSDAYNSLFLKTPTFKKTKRRKPKKRLPLRELPIRNIRNDNCLTALTSDNSIHIHVSLDNTFDKLLKQDKPFIAPKNTNENSNKKNTCEGSSSSGWSCLRQKGDTQISVPGLDDTWDFQSKQKHKPFEISFSFFTKFPKNVEHLFGKDESSLGISCDKFTQNLHSNVKKFCSTPVQLDKKINNKKTENKFCSTPVQVNVKSNKQEISEKSLLDISSVISNKKDTEGNNFCCNITRSSLRSCKKSIQDDTSLHKSGENVSLNAASAVEEGSHRNKDLEIVINSPKISLNSRKTNNLCFSPDLFSDDQDEEFHGFINNQFHYSSSKQVNFLETFNNELSKLSHTDDEENFGNTSKIHKFECINDLRVNITKMSLRSSQHSKVDIPSSASSSRYSSGEESYNQLENQSEELLSTFGREQGTNFANKSSIIKPEPIKELRVKITKSSFDPSQSEDELSNTCSSQSAGENGLHNELFSTFDQDEYGQSQKLSIHKNLKVKPSILRINLTKLIDHEEEVVSGNSGSYVTSRRKQKLSYDQSNRTDYHSNSIDLSDSHDTISTISSSVTRSLQEENLSDDHEEISNSSDTYSPINYRKRTNQIVLQSSLEESNEQENSLLSLSNNIADQTNVLEHINVDCEEVQHDDERRTEVGRKLVKSEDEPALNGTVQKIDDDKFSLSQAKSFDLNEIECDKSVILIDSESPIKLKPGKGWRRSLCLFKNKCGVKLSQESKLKIGRPSFLPCIDCSDIVQDGSLSENLKRLSVVPGESAELTSGTPRDIVLRRCHQKSPMKFSKCFSNSILKNCQKIGEGVYGEVFLLRNPKGGLTVLKIIPIEGDLLVNGERQKKFEEVMSEIIIASELSNLRVSDQTEENFFTKIQKIQCIQGKYPQRLIDLWDDFEETKGTENDSPTLFKDDQLYIAFQMSFGGKDLEAYEFRNAKQAFSAICQVAVGLALAEKQLKFEHRDLHWGNVLIADEPDKKKVFSFHIENKHYKIPLEGIRVSIIDFTLSRIDCNGVTIYNDLSADPGLFAAHGDYQFDVYRLMQKANRNNWTSFEPFTNVLWMHYLLDKSIKGFRYKYPKSNVHKSHIEKLKSLSEVVLKCKNVEEFLCEHVL
ncbi:unnamed protein product [Phyllotreta striolata]|uniref:non-specific serine/threonine protein kinase n=1 Tax=Phyllotreta striolata TaxID=444603 RepID=A0A9N9TLX7_PHYSR|nr:unnamed protein product [Phyllotreta striolata]